MGKMLLLHLTMGDSHCGTVKGTFHLMKPITKNLKLELYFVFVAFLFFLLVQVIDRQQYMLLIDLLYILGNNHWMSSFKVAFFHELFIVPCFFI